ncbi:hypothetical protein HZS_5843, partial [Henneguya salminicola]
TISFDVHPCNMYRTYGNGINISNLYYNQRLNFRFQQKNLEIYTDARILILGSNPFKRYRFRIIKFIYQCKYKNPPSLIKYEFIDHTTGRICNHTYNKYKCDNNVEKFYKVSRIDKDSFCNNFRTKWVGSFKNCASNTLTI